MLSLVRPKFLCRFTENTECSAHAELAESRACRSRIFLSATTGPFRIYEPQREDQWQLQSGAVFVDGLGVGDVEISSDRQQRMRGVHRGYRS